MPPRYDFECTECKKQLDTIVPMSESNVPPEETSDDKCPEHKWVKVILSAPTKKLGPNWGPGKGNWGRDGW